MGPVAGLVASGDNMWGLRCREEENMGVDELCVSGAGDLLLARASASRPTTGLCDPINLESFPRTDLPLVSSGRLIGVIAVVRGIAATEKECLNLPSGDGGSNEIGL